MYLTAPSLARLAKIRHAFFTRAGGVSEGLYESLNGGIGSHDAPDRVRENRGRMAAALGVSDDRLVTCYQVHSPDVVIAEKPWTRQNAPRADAVATRVPGLAIAVTTADCGPVLLADADAGVVGAAHAGWKGAFSGIIEAVIDAMEGLGARRSRIAAALGPMIQQPNYEVGPEFLARFVDADPENRRFFRPSGRNEHALFDLPGYVGARLRRAGVIQIENLGRCTYDDPQNFYSYRRSTHLGEGDYGRHVNAIVLQAD